MGGGGGVKRDTSLSQKFYQLQRRWKTRNRQATAKTQSPKSGIRDLGILDRRRFGDSSFAFMTRTVLSLSGNVSYDLGV